MYDFNANIVVTEESKRILEKFKQSFLNNSYPERVLYINHLRGIEEVLPVEKLTELNVPNKENVYLYHERLKKLYISDFNQICTYIEQLEPWEEVDCLVFDEGFQWFIGITHEDELLLYGIK